MIKAAVYDPPVPGLPFVAVIIGGDGEVLLAKAVRNAAAGEALLQKIVDEFLAAASNEGHEDQ
jgi:hypothetical protein